MMIFFVLLYLNFQNFQNNFVYSVMLFFFSKLCQNMSCPVPRACLKVSLFSITSKTVSEFLMTTHSFSSLSFKGLNVHSVNNNLADVNSNSQGLSGRKIQNSFCPARFNEKKIILLLEN